MQINKNAEKLIKQLNNQGYEAFIVGGCVRDYLLGLTPHDTDICTNALPEQTKKCFEAYHTFDTGIKHGTISVVCGGEVYEITTYRIDGDYSDNRHPDSVSFTRNINEDLQRRDFTVNAMACNAEYGLIDPYGGKNDLKDKVIRCVGNPDTRCKKIADKILHRLRLPSDFINKTLLLIEYHDVRFNGSKKLMKKVMNVLGTDLTKQLLEVEHADISAQSEYQREEKLGYLETAKTHLNEIIKDNECFKLSQLDIHGKDVLNLGVKEGRDVGNILDYLLMLVVDANVPNKKSILISKAKEYIYGNQINK